MREEFSNNYRQGHQPATGAAVSGVRQVRVERRDRQNPRVLYRTVQLLTAVFLSLLWIGSARAGGGATADWPEGLRCVWSRKIPFGEFDTDEGLPVACRKGRLVVVTASGEILSLNVQTGETEWAALLNCKKASVAGLERKVAVVTVSPRELRAFDLSNGTAKWRFTAPADIVRATTSGGRVLVVTANDEVCALDQNSGELKWTRHIEKAKEALTAADGNCFCLLCKTGRMCALEASTGETLWEIQLSRPEGMHIAAAGGRVFVASDEAMLRALDAAKGTPLWTASLPWGVAYLGAHPGAVVCYSYSGIFGLHVFDPHTGKLIGRESLSGGSFYSSAVVEGLLLAPRSSKDLIVFRLDQGYRARTVPVGEEQMAIGTVGCSLILLSESGFISRVEVSPDVLTRRQERTFSVSPFLSFGVITTAIIGILAVAAAGAYAAVFAAGKRVPFTHTSVLKRYVSVTGLALLGLTVGLTAVLVAKYDLLSSGTPTGLLAAFLLALFVLVLLTAGIIFRLWVKWRLTRQDGALHPLEPMSSLSGTVSALLKEMDLTERIDVLCGKGMFSPVALQTDRHCITLILPERLDSLALDACNNHVEESQGLVRLVLAHELAHVRNHDLGILPLAWMLRAVLVWVLLALWAVYAVALLQHDEILTVALKPTLAYASISCTLLYLILASAVRDREKLADATASLYVEPRILARLAASDTHGTTTSLERFLFGLTAWQSAPMYFGFASSRKGIVQKILNFLDGNPRTGFHHLQEFKKEAMDRGGELVSKEHVVSRRSGPSLGVALSAAALGALLFVGLGVVLRSAFVFMWYSSGTFPSSNKAPDFIRASDLWGHLMQSTQLHDGYNLLCGAIVGTVFAVFAMWQLRDSPHRLRGIKIGDLRELAIGLVSMLFLAGILQDIIESFCRPPFPLWPTMRIDFTKASLGAVLVTLFMFALTGMRPSGTQRRRLWVSLAAGLPVVFLVPLLLWGFLSPYFSPFGSLLIIMNALMLTAFLLNLGLLKPLAMEAAVSREWLDYRRLLWFRHARTMWRSGPPPSLSHDLAEFAGVMFLQYVALTVIFVSLAFPMFLAFDSWFFEHYGEISEGAHQFIAQPVDAITALPKTTVIAKCLWGMFVNAAHPEHAYPSTVLGSILLMILFSLFLPLAALKWLLSEASTKETLIRRLPLLHDLASDLKLPAVEAFVRGGLHNLLARRRVPEMPIKGSSGIPLTRATCELIIVGRTFDEYANAAMPMIDWVRKCECPGGGFAALPKAEPDILHTAFALKAIRVMACSQEFRIKAHKLWLEAEVQRHLLAPEEYPSVVWLEDMHYLLEGLRATDESPSGSPGVSEALRRQAIRCWQEAGGRIEATFFLLSIFPEDTSLPTSLTVELEQSWLPKHEASLQTLSPSAQLETAWQLVRIIKRIRPLDYRRRPGASQFSDNLSKSFSRDERTGFLQEMIQKLGWFEKR